MSAVEAPICSYQDPADWWKETEDGNVSQVVTIDGELILNGSPYGIIDERSNPLLDAHHYRRSVEAPTGLAVFPNLRPWDLIRDSSRPPIERAQWLVKRYLDEPDLVRRFVFRSLCDDVERLPRDWRDELVVNVERMYFVDPMRRAKLTDSLLAIADEHAFDTAIAGNENVFNSALRMAASMIEIGEVSQLRRFLDPPASFDGRLMALIGLINIYEVEPGLPTTNEISDRVHELCTRFLDPDHLVPGEKGAMAVLTIHALATFGDQRLLDMCRHTVDLGRPWLTMAVKHRLSNLEERWRPSNHPNVEVLTASLRVLETSEG